MWLYSTALSIPFSIDKRASLFGDVCYFIPDNTTSNLSVVELSSGNKL
jgi:hypothetical protein